VNAGNRLGYITPALGVVSTRLSQVRRTAQSQGMEFGFGHLVDDRTRRTGRDGRAIRPSTRICKPADLNRRFDALVALMAAKEPDYVRRSKLP